MKKSKLFVAILCISLVAAISMTAIAAEVFPAASASFSTRSTSLSTSLKLTASAVTYSTCEKLGVKSYTLYKSNGTAVKTWSPESYSKADHFSSSFDLSSAASKGQSYYATVTFYADGETKTSTTTTVKY